MLNHQATKKEPVVRLCLISEPGPICDATCATIAHTARTKLVAIASGALSATNILQRIQTDVVLLDANLPDEEVVALLQWLAEHCQRAKTVVATLTSGQLHKALAFGAAAAMRRDELPTKLTMLVDDLLGAIE